MKKGKKLTVISFLLSSVCLSVVAESVTNNLDVQGGFIYNHGAINPGDIGLTFTNAGIRDITVSAGQLSGVDPETGAVITNSANLLPLKAQSLTAVGDIVAGGSFIGDGSQLSNLNGGAFSGSLNASILPTSGVWNASGVTVSNLTVGNLTGDGSGLINLPVPPELAAETAARIVDDNGKLDKTGGTLTGGLKISMPFFGTVADLFGNLQGNINIGLGAGSNSTGVLLANLGNNSGTGSSGTNQFNVGEDSGSYSSGTKAYNFGVMAGKNSSGNNQVSLGRNAGRWGTNDYYLYIENWKVAPTNTAATLNGAFVLNGDTGELWLGRPNAETHLRGTVTGNGSGLTNLTVSASSLPTSGVWNASGVTITNAHLAGNVTVSSLTVATNLTVQGTIIGNGSGLGSVAAGGSNGELQFNENGVLAGNTNVFMHPTEHKLAFRSSSGNFFRGYNSETISDNTLIYSLRNEDGTSVLRLRQNGQDKVVLFGDGSISFGGETRTNWPSGGEGTSITYVPAQGDLAMGIYTNGAH